MELPQPRWSLGQELEDFKNALPEGSVLQLDRQWMYETMETDLFHFNGVVGCYLLYQGGRCLLMRRRALLYLREMSAALEGSRLVPDEANRVALQKALSSAVSMARFIAALLKWPGAVQRIPNIFIPPIVQGSMTLVMTDGLIAPFTRSPDFGEITTSHSFAASAAGIKPSQIWDVCWKSSARLTGRALRHISNQTI
ncbi:hypothetical protein DFJ73DRAFT_824867 [Zopfochytrium polystomum]|nr:hypothetical protein DFJ73DRAFT_824867 [Zopfochytrium polystomum]